MKQTQNFQLNQWEMSDRIQMGDFNADNQKIDGVLHEIRQQLAEQAIAIGKRGNCRIEAFSYTGDGNCGSSHPTTLTFSAPPLLAIVISDDGDLMTLLPNATGTIRHTASSGSNRLSISWEGNTVSWAADSSYAYSQMNYNGRLYFVLAFYRAD